MATTTIEISMVALRTTLYGSLVMFVRHFAAIWYDGLAGTAAGYRAPEDESVIRHIWFLPQSKQNFGYNRKKTSLPQNNNKETDDPQNNTKDNDNELAIEDKTKKEYPLYRESSEIACEDKRRLEERKARSLRILGNDMENVPFGLIISWGGLLCSGNPQVHAAGVGIFVVGRVLHTFTYMAGLQPWRSIAFVLGMVGTIIILVNAIVGVESL